MEDATRLELSKKLSIVFTNQRIRLLKTIQKKEPESVGNLAKLVNRDVAAVYRDLKILEEHDIIELVKDGKTVQPLIKNQNLLITLSKDQKEPENGENNMDYIG